MADVKYHFDLANTDFLFKDMGGYYAMVVTFADSPTLDLGEVKILGDDGNPVLGQSSDAAVVTDADGTLHQYLRGLVKLVAAKIGVKIADGDSATLGVTTGAAVVTDAAGTVQQYLRGLVKLIAGKITVGIDQTTQGTTNLVYSSDNGPAWTTSWGVGGVPLASADAHSAAISVTDAPAGGQKLVIDDLIVSVDTTMNVTFKCETSGAVIFGPLYIGANSVVQITPRGKGKKLATPDKKLQVITSVAGNISVSTSYHSEA